MRGPIAIAASAALTLLGARAAAHGTFPSTERIVLDEDGGPTLVVQASFGLLVSEDAGTSWGWVCTDVLGSLETEDPRIALSASGSVLVASFTGLRRGDALGCGWSEAPELMGSVVIDLDRDRSAPDAFVAVTSTGGRDNSLFRTTDGGLTWAPTGAPVDRVLFESVRVSASDPSHIVMVGAQPPRPPEPRRAFVYVSVDGGATFERHAFDALEEGENLRLLGIDPRDPDRVYLRALASGSSGASPAVAGEEPERLFLSEDGGRTWRLMMEAPELGSIAWLGDDVYLGGRFGTGLLRSSDGERFEQVRAMSVGCLVSRGAELFACASQYTDGFAIGVSRDGGSSFEPLLDFDQVAAARACGADDATSMVCVPREPWLETTLRPPRAASGCHVSPGARAHSWALPVVLCLAWRLRRSARGRSRARGRRPRRGPTARR